MSTVSALATTANVNVGAFRTAIKNVTTAIPTGAVRDMQRLISIESNGDNTATVAHCSYTLYAAVTLPAKTTSKGHVELEGRKFNKTLTAALAGNSKAINNSDLDLTIEENGLQFTFDGVQINVSSPDDETPDHFVSQRERVESVVGDATTLATVKAEDLIAMYGKVSHAVSDDDSLTMITGINMSVDKNNLVFAATDRFRLSKLNVEADIAAVADEFDGFLIPGSAVKTLAALLPNDDSNVRISFANKEYLLFETDNVVLATRLLDAVFPATNHLIQDGFNQIVEFDRAALKKAVSKLNKLCGNVNRQTITVKSTVNGTILTVDMEGDDKATVDMESTVEVYSADYSEMLLALNGKFLADAINAYDCDTVKMAIMQPGRPIQLLQGAITAEEGDTCLVLSKRDHVELLMPVRLAE